MAVFLSGSMYTAGPELGPMLRDFCIVGLAIIGLGMGANWLLIHYGLRTVRRKVSARLSRARAVVAKLKDRKLSSIGRQRYMRACEYLSAPAPANVLRSYSRRAYRRSRVAHFLRRCISPILLDRTKFSAHNFRIGVFAAIIVLIRSKNSAWLKSVITYLHERIPWHSIAEWLREWYGLVSVIIVVSIVATRSPLVDRVRARDESAKDANRLLTQLFGKLSNLQRSADEYLDLVTRSRANTVAKAVLEATDNVYTWTYGDGLIRCTFPGMYGIPQHWFGDTREKLDEACQNLTDHLAEYRNNGLHTVATRLTWPVFDSLFECAILFSNAELSNSLRTRLLIAFPGKLGPLVKDAIKNMDDAKRDGEADKYEIWRTNANDFIWNYAELIDENVAAAYVTLFHLSNISTFLNKRLHGDTRTRVAGSFMR